VWLSFLESTILWFVFLTSIESVCLVMQAPFVLPLPLGRAMLEEHLAVDDSFAKKVVARMAEVVFRSSELLSNISLLPAGQCTTVSVSRLQVLCLMCNAFFGLLQRQGANGEGFPPVPRFTTLKRGHPLWPFFEHYFSEAILLPPHTLQGQIVLSRVVERMEPDLLASTQSLLGCVFVSEDETIEDASDCDAHVNFANCMLSGHLFGGAIAQEEILFSFRPELCVTAILCEKMSDKEVVVISGARRWCNIREFCVYGFSVLFQVTLGRLDTDVLFDARRLQTKSFDTLQLCCAWTRNMDVWDDRKRTLTETLTKLSWRFLDQVFNRRRRKKNGPMIIC
jgi:hypothetical protein